MMLDEEELKAIQTQKVKRSMSKGMDEGCDSADEGDLFDNLYNTRLISSFVVWATSIMTHQTNTIFPIVTRHRYRSAEIW